MSPASHRTAPGVGVSGAGRVSCHHGEILQGAFLDTSGRRCAGLVTLPMTGLGSRAEFTRHPGTPPEQLAVLPGDRTRAARAAALTVEGCALRRREPPCGGELRVTGDISVGLGMGSSTSDVIAVVRAVADSYGMRLPPDTIAQLAVRAELACDLLMLDAHPLLFAQRQGRVLEVLGHSLPPLVVVGARTQSSGGPAACPAANRNARRSPAPYSPPRTCWSATRSRPPWTPTRPKRSSPNSPGSVHTTARRCSG